MQKTSQSEDKIYLRIFVDSYFYTMNMIHHCTFHVDYDQINLKVSSSASFGNLIKRKQVVLLHSDDNYVSGANSNAYFSKSTHSLDI